MSQTGRVSAGAQRSHSLASRLFQPHRQRTLARWRTATRRCPRPCGVTFASRMRLDNRVCTTTASSLPGASGALPTRGGCRARRSNAVFADAPIRLFLMRARMFGIPVQAFHRLIDGHATIRVAAGGIVPIVNDSGDAMDRAETVTLFPRHVHSGARHARGAGHQLGTRGCVDGTRPLHAARPHHHGDAVLRGCRTARSLRVRPSCASSARPQIRRRAIPDADARLSRLWPTVPRRIRRSSLAAAGGRVRARRVHDARGGRQRDEPGRPRWCAPAKSVPRVTSEC